MIEHLQDIVDVLSEFALRHPGLTWTIDNAASGPGRLTLLGGTALDVQVDCVDDKVFVYADFQGGSDISATASASGALAEVHELVEFVMLSIAADLAAAAAAVEELTSPEREQGEQRIADYIAGKSKVAKADGRRMEALARERDEGRELLEEARWWGGRVLDEEWCDRVDAHLEQWPRSSEP